MKIVIGLPCMGSIRAETVGSLCGIIKAYRNIDIVTYIMSNSLIYHARNEILNFTIKENADYLLFLDSDIKFPVSALQRLLDLNQEVVTGIYYARTENNHNPIIYEEIIPRGIFRKHPKAKAYTGKIQGLTRVSGCGMGFCLIRKDVIKKMIDKYISPFEPFRGMGEDIAFCYRLTRIGIPIYALDVGLEHIGTKYYRRETL